MSLLSSLLRLIRALAQAGTDSPPVWCILTRTPWQHGNGDAQRDGGVGRKRAVAQTGEIPCYPTLKWREDAWYLNQVPLTRE